jgi:hypothetical protein
MLFSTRKLAPLLLSLAVAGCGGGGGDNSSTLPPFSNETPPAGGGASGSGTPSLATATSVIDGTPMGVARWADGPTATGASGQTVDGLSCTLDSGNFSFTHLSIFVDGQQVAVPADIGVVKPVSPTPLFGCRYPIQTNDRSGKIRTMNGAGAYTLGQFFALWGQPLNTSTVADSGNQPVKFFVNDNGNLSQVSGDPAAIALTPNREITIVIGTPPAQIPTFAWTDPPPLSSTPTQLVFGTTVGTVMQWPDGDTAAGGRGQPVDGLSCGPMDETYHVHPRLTIVHNGNLLIVPQDIGIPSCAYSIHSHDRTGIIHVEAPKPDRRFTLGNYFDIWGQPLSPDNVAGIAGEPVVVYIEDGGNLRRWMGDIRDIDLFTHRSITIQIGSALTSIPSWDWSVSGYLQ